MKIIITSPADAYEDETDELVTDKKRLQALDGLDFSTLKCADYLDSKLEEIGIRGGLIRLAWQQGKLWAVTEYAAPRKLTTVELAELVEYTRGQWSDGIGEGEFRHARKHKLQIDISPIGAERKIKTTQVDDGKKIPVPRDFPLHKALEQKNVQLARELIAAGIKLDMRDKYGHSPLQLACSQGLFEIALELVRAGANVQAQDKSGATALANLCRSQEASQHPKEALAVFKALMKNGAQVDSGDKEGITPLMWASNRGNLELIKALLKAGADVNARDRVPGNLKTVVMYAQHTEAINLLLKRGADPRVKTAFSKTAWEYALLNSHRRGYREQAELLRKHGEKLDKKKQPLPGA